jgi:hypothetical protein
VTPYFVKALPKLDHVKTSVDQMNKTVFVGIATIIAVQINIVKFPLEFATIHA